jgi:hypothetical protein
VQPITLSAQGSIEVRGAHVAVDGNPAIIAATLRRDNQTLHL